jgi:hypothetical protein
MYIAAWWWESLLLDGLLPWFDEVLDRGDLMAMLCCIWRWIRWWWRHVVSYSTCNGLF